MKKYRKLFPFREETLGKQGRVLHPVARQSPAGVGPGPAPSNWRDMDPPSQAGLGPAPSPEAGGGFAGAGRQQEHQARPAVLSVRGAFQGYGGTCCQADLLPAVWTSAMGGKVVSSVTSVIMTRNVSPSQVRPLCHQH